VARAPRQLTMRAHLCSKRRTTDVGRRLVDSVGLWGTGSTVQCTMSRARAVSALPHVWHSWADDLQAQGGEHIGSEASGECGGGMLRTPAYPVCVLRGLERPLLAKGAFCPAWGSSQRPQAPECASSEGSSVAHAHYRDESQRCLALCIRIRR
jgi:hypothetical protein